MGKGSRVIIISGLFHGYRGVIVDITLEGKVLVHLDHEDFGWEFKSFEVELEERKDLWEGLV